MNRIVAVALFSIAVAIGTGACHQVYDSPPQVQPVVDDSFVDFYLGAITGTRLAPGEYRPGTNPLTEMLGK